MSTQLENSIDSYDVVVTEPLAIDRARCADGEGGLTHLFFSDDAHDLARAKSICSKCLLADDCRSRALERAEYYGVWGGVLIMEGTIVEDRPRRGRPRKDGPLTIIVDEVPVPPHLVA